VSLQDGVRNADVLRTGLGGRRVLGGVVGFNVVPKGQGTFLRATTGRLVLEACRERHAESLLGALDGAGFDVEAVADVRSVQWAKLIMNLNNAVSALSGVPTREILMSRGYRAILGATIAEALEVLRAAHVRPARLGLFPVSSFPALLRLPTPVLRVFARAQLRIDPEARSSMWEDLARGRPTEVDELNGEIVRLASEHGMDAPLNRRVVELVHDVEAKASGCPAMSPEALWQALKPRTPRAYP
jgi:2-dehydropantoate 2-reductase